MHSAPPSHAQGNYGYAYPAVFIDNVLATFTMSNEMQITAPQGTVKSVTPNTLGSDVTSATFTIIGSGFRCAAARCGLVYFCGALFAVLSAVVLL